jgi:FxsC-like protein
MGPNPPESAPSSSAEFDAFGPAFFLSYSRVAPLRGDRSDPDYWVKRFFHELAAEIRSLDANLRHGFIADHVPPGSSPETMTARSLAACRIFVPLYGDEYFEDEVCGREWTVFEQRRALRRARTGDDGESIVPVLWTRQGREDWPDVARRTRPGPLLSNDLYLRLGLFELIRLHERAYHEVVRLLAREIVRRAHTEAPPVAAEDALSWATPAFPAPGRSTRQLFITVVAAVRRSVPPERNSDYYGDRPEDWRPYQPESQEPIAMRAARIARSLGYQPEIRVLSATSPEVKPDVKVNSHVRPGAPFLQPSAASILLADPWLFQGFRERRNLETVDLRRKEWVRLMVPWCATDREIAERRTSLEAHVHSAVPVMMNSWRRTCQRHLVDLATAEEFDEALPAVIERARNHYLDNSRPSRDAGSGGYSGRPRLAPPPEDEPPRRGPG